MDLILFAGDMIGSGNCYTVEGLGISVMLVYGNNDADRDGLAREFARMGGEPRARASSLSKLAAQEIYLSFISCRISLTLAFKTGISSSAVSQTCLRSIPKY